MDLILSQVLFASSSEKWQRQRAMYQVRRVKIGKTAQLDELARECGKLYMTVRFDGQVAIVTGSGRGLGKAYVTLLTGRGASVVVHDAGVALDGTGFDPSIANAVVQEIIAAGGKAVPCYENIETHEGCLRLIDTALSQFSRLDILIHNAGWITFTPLEEMTPELLERVLYIQVKATFCL